jgi:hypothetical protein
MSAVTAITTLTCLFAFSACGKGKADASTEDNNINNTINDPSVVSVTPTEKLYYELAEDGKSCVLSGIGTATEKVIIIPESYNGLAVTSIAASAFLGCTQITGVVVPETVTSIGSNAFSKCENLAQITLPDSITYIGMDAFYDTAYYNNNLTAENCVLYIGNYVIDVLDDYLSGDYVVKDGTVAIANAAFKNSSHLNSVTIPDSVVTIGENAFENCYYLTTVNMGKGVTSIGRSAFYQCERLNSITIPDGVNIINDYTFYWCDIRSIVIPDGVTNMGDYGFSNCFALTEITIPASVTYIGEAEFYNCQSLTKINFDGKKSEWSKIVKWDNWKTNSGSFTVYCLDGEVDYDKA